ncbi:FtsX-like permease family protein [candidate division KSB1 bacterium]|nr:FtsX-like permease family protein [candidate division KSB1 bacterium]NIR71776.1 FtsX-like permease family protein [candidate division KSB1 bacterium]NIS25758.1 FtsX-like permease family protein [candidate division KSB1 bacterium]NIT72627.1 FtsX-like permease family protein [candidate division KSB1 bacterium]NIU26448.1 FtsX-like permease family protein [candidate division KSB1 bacterium]
MFKNYLKVAIRNFLKHKLFSLINVSGLAIGMACCILILLWVEDELGYDTFHENANRIYRVIKLDKEDVTDGIARVGAPWGPALFKDYPEVESFVRFRFFSRSLVRYQDKVFFEEGGLYADSTIFDVFTFPLIKGNPKTALTQPNTLVISEDLAQKYFGDEEPIGKRLIIDNDEEYQVTGVVKNVPRNSHFHFDFLVSFVSYNFFDLNAWRMNNFHVYLLLKPDVSPAVLEQKFPEFVRTHITDDEPINYLVKLQPITDIHLHSDLFREFEANGDIAYVYIFTAIAVFILLIACINFMNLATARSANRCKEVGLRKVVGAQRLQVINQFLGESVLLSFLALLAAIGLSELLLPTFGSMAGKELSVHYFDNPALFFALIAISLFVGLLAGAYPALFLSSFRPISVLKGMLNSGAASATTVRKGLVVLQFTIAIVLIIGTTVVFQQLNYIRNKKLGMNQEQILVVRLQDDAAKQKYNFLKNELLQNPNVISAAASANLPGGGDWGMPFEVEGRAENDRFSSRVLVVDHDYLETMEIDLVAGRNFSRQMGTDESEAFLINQTAAEQLGWESPIGKRIARPIARNEDGSWNYQSGHVIGVVDDFHFRSLHQTIQPLVMYIQPESFRYLSIRLTAANISDTMDFIKGKWQAFEPERPVDYFFLDQVFDQMYHSEERLERIFGAFAILAIFVACLGLFGLASFTAEQRTKEIGIRKTLGATVSNIVLLISKDFSKWVIVANVVAWPVAYSAMQNWLQDFAYRMDFSWTSPLLWQTLLFAAFLALTIALLTVSYQAIKAAVTNPANALRYE